MTTSGNFCVLIMLLAWMKTLTIGLMPYVFHATKTRSLPNPVIPRSFSEKMLWRKIFDRNPIFIEMTDKLEARKLANNRCPGILFPEILWIGEGEHDFPFESIELPVVVKANNGSGWNFFLRDRSMKERRNLMQFFRKMRKHRNFGRTQGEWAYQSIQRRFYAERELMDENGLPPDDYKLYMASGKLVQMHVSHDRWGDKALVNFDQQLQAIPVDEVGWRRNYVPRDWHLIDQVISACRALAMDLDFIRIDLYVFESKVYFGEFTVYPGSGTMGSAEVTKLRGKGWDISKSYYFQNNMNWFKRKYLCLLKRLRKNSGDS